MLQSKGFPKNSIFSTLRTLNILSNIDDYLYHDPIPSGWKQAHWYPAVSGHTFLQDAIHIPREMKFKEQCDTSDDSESDYEADREKSTVLYSYFKLWKTQAIPLAKFKLYDNRHDSVLVPHRFLPIYKSNDPFQLMETTVIQRGLQPTNLCLSASMLCEAHMHLVEHYSNQGKIDDYKLLLKSLLGKIVVLVLTEMFSAEVDSLRYIINAVVGRGKNNTLKALEINPCDHGYWQDRRQTLNLIFLKPHLFTDPPCQPNYQGLYKHSKSWSPCRGLINPTPQCSACSAMLTTACFYLSPGCLRRSTRQSNQ